jgi:hypothetical protein
MLVSRLSLAASVAAFALTPPLRSRRLGRIAAPGAAHAGPRRGLTLSGASAAGALVRMGEINTPDRGLKFKAVWFDLDDTLWSGHFPLGRLQSIRAHRCGGHGLFSAPKLTDLYRTPSVST